MTATVTAWRWPANLETHRTHPTISHHLGMGQNLITRGPQVLVQLSFTKVPSGLPIFDDPQPFCPPQLIMVSGTKDKHLRSPNSDRERLRKGKAFQGKGMPWQARSILLFFSPSVGPRKRLDCGVLRNAIGVMQGVAGHASMYVLVHI